MVSFEFFIDVILPVLGSFRASNKNEFQGYFVGLKAAGAYG